MARIGLQCEWEPWQQCDWCNWWGKIDSVDWGLPDKFCLIEGIRVHRDGHREGYRLCLRCMDLDEPPWWPNNIQRCENKLAHLLPKVEIITNFALTSSPSFEQRIAEADIAGGDCNGNIEVVEKTIPVAVVRLTAEYLATNLE